MSANRGYILARRVRKSKAPVRIHALVGVSGEIDLHEDHERDGKHVSSGHTPRIKRFIEICKAVDEGRDPEISPKMRKNYHFAGPSTPCGRKKQGVGPHGWWRIYDRA